MLLMMWFLTKILTCRLLYLVTLADLLLPAVCYHCEPDCDTSERHLYGCALPLQWHSWCTKGFALQQSRQLMVGALKQAKRREPFSDPRMRHQYKYGCMNKTIARFAGLELTKTCRSLASSRSCASFKMQQSKALPALRMLNREEAVGVCPYQRRGTAEESPKGGAAEEECSSGENKMQQ